MKRLTKSDKNKVIFGVCGGLGEYFERDPILFRLLFVILLFMTGFFPFIIAYIILALMLPDAKTKNEEGKNTGDQIFPWKKGWFWVLLIVILAFLVIPFVFLIGFISYRISGGDSVINEDIYYPVRERVIR